MLGSPRHLRGRTMQFKPFEPGIEVVGQTVYAIVDGFGAFSLMAGRFLLAEGIGQDDGSGGATIVPDLWYSQTAWLRAFEKISTEVGDSALLLIGLKIPTNARFPPWVIDIDSAVRSVDVAFHLNHRKHGQVMFDPDTGNMLEGIGHYGYERSPGRNLITSVCNNPYPCSFDRGILTTMARRFVSGATVVHDDGQPCRKRGEESCTYRVSW